MTGQGAHGRRWTNPPTIPGWLEPHIEEVLQWPAAPQAPACRVPECDRPRVALGLCRAHRDRFRHRARRAGTSTRRYIEQAPAHEVLGAEPVRTVPRVCWVQSCSGVAWERGLCWPHCKRAEREFRGGSGSEAEPPSEGRCAHGPAGSCAGCTPEGREEARP